VTVVVTKAAPLACSAPYWSDPDDPGDHWTRGAD